MTTDTPRTDAVDKASFQSGKWFENYSAILSLSHELERELRTMQEERDRAMTDAASFAAKWHDAEKAQSSREKALVEAAQNLLFVLQHVHLHVLNEDFYQELSAAETKQKAALKAYEGIYE